MKNQIYLPTVKSPEAQMIAERIDTITKAIPPGVVPQQFIIAAFSELNLLAEDRVAKKQAALFPVSVVKSVFNCALLGLIPGSTLGHAYFVPFNNTQKKRVDCQLIVGYKGMLDLAYGCDFLTDIHCEVVLQGEGFRQWNNSAGPQIEHEIPIDRDLRRENVIGAYCIYHSRNGGHGVAVVGRRELDKVDTRQNVWYSDYVAMAKKTPIRRAAKEWRITHRLGLALRLDEQAEAGVEQDADLPDDDKGVDSPFSLKDIPQVED